MAYYNPYQSQYMSQMQAAQPVAPVQVQHPQTYTPVQSQGGLNWVQGIEAAKSYLVAPNNTVLLMDSESQRFYIKTSDASGMPLPLRVFEYAEVTQNAPNNASSAQVMDLSSYATKAEFDAFRAEIEGILKNVPKQVAKTKEVNADG